MPGTHQWYDGTPHPWEFKRVWHLEPSLTDPDTVYAGVEDAALFRTTDGGQTWHELPGLREHGTGPRWQPGAGGLCLHTILLDPTNPQRIFIAISAAGAFRTDDGGETWKPINQGLQLAVHSRSRRPRSATACIASRCTRRGPNVLFMQKHWDVMRSDDAGDSWREVSGNLPTDFGFAIDVHAHEPETIYVVPIKSDSEHYPPDGKLRVYRSRTGGNEWEALTKGLPQSDCYVNVLRDAMAVDSLDPCGIYFGTTGGQVYASPDGGDTWAPIVRDLPAGALGRGADAAHDPASSRAARICGRWRASAARSTVDVDGPVTQRRGARRARGALSGAARHDSRPRHAEAAAVRAVLRVRGGSVARAARRAAARRGRQRRRAVPDRRRDGRRVAMR